MIMSYPLLAVESKLLFIAEKILKAGANTSIRNKYNQNAIQMGKKYFKIYF